MELSVSNIYEEKIENKQAKIKRMSIETQLLNEDEFLQYMNESILNKYGEKQIRENEINNNCIDCEVSMIFNSHNEYCCPKCGRIEICDKERNIVDHNNTIYSSNLMIKGPNSNQYQKILYKYSSDEYKELRKKSIYDLLYKINMDNNEKVSIDIINKTVEYYVEIIDTGKTIRKNIKAQTLAGCFEIACSNAGIDMRTKEIAEIFKLNSNKYSKGRNIIKDLYAQGKISFIFKENPTKSYINRYFKQLNLDKKYKKFILDMVKRSKHKNIGLNSYIYTKIIGMIWILILALELNITKKDIDSICDIRINTFKKFSDKIIKEINQFKKIFIKYDIPFDKLINSGKKPKKEKK